MVALTAATLLAAATPASSKGGVAILPLHAVDGAEADRQAAEGSLVRMTADVFGVKVAGPNELRGVLGSAGLERAAACRSASCIVEETARAAPRFVVISEVGGAGEARRLTLRVVDVPRTSVAADAKGEIGVDLDLLDARVRSVVVTVLERTLKAMKEAPPPPPVAPPPTKPPPAAEPPAAEPPAAEPPPSEPAPAAVPPPAEPPSSAEPPSAEPAEPYDPGPAAVEAPDEPTPAAVPRAAPPSPPGKTRHPNRDDGYFHLGLGTGNCAEDGSLLSACDKDNIGSGFALDIAGGFRRKFIAFGGGLHLNFLTMKDEEMSELDAIFLFRSIYLAARVHPVSEGILDPFVGMGIGANAYTLGLSVDGDSAVTTTSGWGLFWNLGTHLYATDDFALGAEYRRYLEWTVDEICVAWNNEGQDCAKPDGEPKAAGFWTGLVTLTFY